MPNRFEFIIFFSGCAQMTVDQAYWQSAIAGKASSAAKVGASQGCMTERPCVLKLRGGPVWMPGGDLCCLLVPCSPTC